MIMVEFWSMPGTNGLGTYAGSLTFATRQAAEQFVDTTRKAFDKDVIRVFVRGERGRGK